MDVRLSAEQQALVDSVAHVVRDLGVDAVGQLDDAERAAKLDAAVDAAGWRELRGAADDGTDQAGAPWASGVEVALIAEQLARGCADTAFIGPTVATELRRLAGAPPASDVETVLMTRDLDRIAVDGPDQADGLAVDAAGATDALALRAADGGWSLVSVAVTDPETTTDLTRPVARAAGTASSVDGQIRVLTDDDLTRVRALGLATTAGDLVGVMQGATDLSTAYAGERRQYGQPVGAFQAVQHLLADALVVTEGARTIARHAAWAVDALTPTEALVAAAQAKAYAARAAADVCETAIQVHGGIGNTWECLAHVYLRRALLSTDLFGGVGPCLDLVLADRLQGSPSP